MIKSNTPITTTIMLLGGSFLILAIPSWMVYVMFISLAATLSIHWGIKHRQKIKNIWHFIAEFCGFCLMVTLFVSTTILLNHLLVA